MAKLVLKIKTKSGQHIVNSLLTSSTVGELKEHISSLTEIPVPKICILTGFPPKVLACPDSSRSLSDVNIKSGDTLIVEEKLNAQIIEEANVEPPPKDISPPPNVVSPPPKEVVPPPKEALPPPKETLPPPKEDSPPPKEDSPPPKKISPPPKDVSPPLKDFSPPPVIDDALEGGLLMRQVVPADNSCLFTSLGFVLSGKVDTTCGSYMRQIIAEDLRYNPDEYSEAILGKPLAEYCDWILKPESWGGAIELAVLSRHYGLEIAVVDTQSAVINRFGEDKNYDYRVFLIFDGIHYDPLYREPLEVGGAIQTLFLRTNEKVLRMAEELAVEAKTSKQFTDVNRFTLRCLVCRQELTGQVQAQRHAESTGHLNFGEIAS